MSAGQFGVSDSQDAVPAGHLGMTFSRLGVSQFKSANATFVTDYQNTRIIVDAAAGRTCKPTPPSP